MRMRKKCIPSLRLPITSVLFVVSLLYRWQEVSAFIYVSLCLEMCVHKRAHMT